MLRDKDPFFNHRSLPVSLGPLRPSAESEHPSRGIRSSYYLRTRVPLRGETGAHVLLRISQQVLVGHVSSHAVSAILVSLMSIISYNCGEPSPAHREPEEKRPKGGDSGGEKWGAAIQGSCRTPGAGGQSQRLPRVGPSLLPALQTAGCG